MEKYRTFADEGTGCQPFVPTYYSMKQLRAGASNSFFISFLFYCISIPLQLLLFLLAIVRMILLLLAVLLAGLLLLLLLPLRVLPSIHWRLERLLLQLPLRIVFFALGFHRIQEESAGSSDALFLPLPPYLAAFSLSGDMRVKREKYRLAARHMSLPRSIFSPYASPASVGLYTHIHIWIPYNNSVDNHKSFLYT